MRGLVISFIALSMLFMSAAVAKAPEICTIKGTVKSDRLIGNANANVICALKGDDYANGRGGNDSVRGGDGEDVVIGGAGRDFIRGRPGNDRVFGVDDRGGDVLYGGRGFDRCFGDFGDSFDPSCEIRLAS